MLLWRISKILSLDGTDQAWEDECKTFSILQVRRVMRVFSG